MAVDAVVSPPPVAPSRPPLVRSVGRWAGLAAWVVVVVTVLLVAQRPASFEDLRTAVAQGRVDRVEVSDWLPDGAVGSTIEAVTWREGWKRFRTTVRVTTPGMDSGARPGDGGPTVSLTEDAGAVLATARPDAPPTTVRVQEAAWWVDVAGWRVPLWLGLLVLPLLLPVLARATGGARPRRSTR